MRTIVIEGRVYDWKEIRRLRREQTQAAQRTNQLTLFELKEDARPPTQKTADARYQEPLLFE